MGSITAIKGTLSKYGYFYWEERNGGRLDIKNERQWNMVFNNNPRNKRDGVYYCNRRDTA